MEKVKVLILTDINVSNVHYAIAKMLRTDYGVSYLNLCGNSSFFDNHSWYKCDDISQDLSKEVKMWGKIPNIFKVTRMVKNADVCICSGFYAAIVRFLMKPYVYFSYGSDLDQYANYGCSIFERNDMRNSYLNIRGIIYVIRKLLYKYSIGGASITLIAPYQYGNICKIGYKRLDYMPHIIEEQFLNFDLNNKEKEKRIICKEYDCDYVLFSSTRHVWNDSVRNENDYKGNDVVIRSLAKLIEKNAEFMRVKLFLIEKGQDVNKTKELAERLNITPYIKWLKPMDRKKLIRYYSASDACFDQFSLGCLAMSAVEAMACGNPTISYIGIFNYDKLPFYKILPPVFNCNNEEEIVLFLEKILTNEKYKKELGRESYKWVQENCSEDNFKRKINRIMLEL